MADDRNGPKVVDMGSDDYWSFDEPPLLQLEQGEHALIVTSFWFERREFTEGAKNKLVVELQDEAKEFAPVEREYNFALKRGRPHIGKKSRLAVEVFRFFPSCKFKPELLIGMRLKCRCVRSEYSRHRNRVKFENQITKVAEILGRAD